MKKYISMELEIVKFMAEDIVTVSDPNASKTFGGSWDCDNDIGSFGFNS